MKIKNNILLNINLNLMINHVNIKYITQIKNLIKEINQKNKIDLNLYQLLLKINLEKYKIKVIV